MTISHPKDHDWGNRRALIFTIYRFLSHIRYNKQAQIEFMSQEHSYLCFEQPVGGSSLTLIQRELDFIVTEHQSSTHNLQDCLECCHQIQSLGIGIQVTAGKNQSGNGGVCGCV